MYCIVLVIGAPVKLAASPLPPLIASHFAAGWPCLLTRELPAQVVLRRPQVVLRPHVVLPVSFWLTLMYLLLTYRGRGDRGSGDAF